MISPSPMPPVPIAPQCPGKIQANNPVETYKFNHVNKKGIGICR